MAEDGYYYPVDDDNYDGKDGYYEGQNGEGQECYESQQNNYEAPAEADQATYQQQQEEATKTEAYEPVGGTSDVGNGNDNDDDDSDRCCRCVVM